MVNLYIEILEGRKRMQNKTTANTTMASATQDKGGFFNVLMGRHPQSVTKGTINAPEREIICNDQMISKSDKEGLIRLYEALVPGDKTRTVNLNMIMSEALPAFEEVILPIPLSFANHC